MSLVKLHERKSEVKKVKAETTAVEVDDVNLIAEKNVVARVEVRVNETEMLSCALEPSKMGDNLICAGSEAKQLITV